MKNEERKVDSYLDQMERSLSIFDRTCNRYQRMADHVRESEANRYKILEKFVLFFAFQSETNLSDHLENKYVEQHFPYSLLYTENSENGLEMNEI